MVAVINRRTAEDMIWSHFTKRGFRRWVFQIISARATVVTRVHCPSCNIIQVELAPRIAQATLDRLCYFALDISQGFQALERKVIPKPIMVWAARNYLAQLRSIAREAPL